MPFKRPINIMRYFKIIVSTFSSCLLMACAAKGKNPHDPYEPFNRKIHTFNSGIDKVVLKPLAKVYKAVLPSPLRAGINNVYNNVNMLPTIANDLLQGDRNYALKDTWRFIINSSMGIAGILDAASSCGLPPHSNDLGLTFAKWGNKESPYVVIPLLGPSTFRDGVGLMFDYALFTPYPYIRSSAALYSILGVRYVDLRSQMLETDKIIDESFDKYAFIRDAYLQHRNYLILGKKQEAEGSLYVEEDSNTLLTETPANGTESQFPLTTN